MKDAHRKTEMHAEYLNQVSKPAVESLHRMVLCSTCNTLDEWCYTNIYRQVSQIEANKQNTYKDCGCPHCWRPVDANSGASVPARTPGDEAHAVAQAREPPGGPERRHLSAVDENLRMKDSGDWNSLRKTLTVDARLPPSVNCNKVHFNVLKLFHTVHSI